LERSRVKPGTRRKVERGRTIDFFTDLIADERFEAADDLELATRKLTVEVGELRASLAELRVMLASDKARPLDLPNPFSPRRFN
jgi:hypothetical protein